MKLKKFWNNIDIIMTILIGFLALVLTYFIPVSLGNWAFFTAFRLFEVVLASCGIILIFVGFKAWFARNEYDNMWRKRF